MSISEEELQRRIADVQARVLEPIREEAERLLRDDPTLTPREAGILASQAIQRRNQQRRPWWQLW